MAQVRRLQEQMEIKEEAYKNLKNQYDNLELNFKLLSEHGLEKLFKALEVCHTRNK